MTTPSQPPQDADDDEFVGADQLTDQLLEEVEDQIVELVAAQIDGNEARIGTSMVWLLRGGPRVATSAIGYLLQIVESLVNIVAATHHRPPARVWMEFARRWNPPVNPEPAPTKTASPAGTGHGHQVPNGADVGTTEAGLPEPAGVPRVIPPVIPGRDLPAGAGAVFGDPATAPEDLETGIAAWGLAVEACAAWRAHDRDRVVDTVAALLADATLAPYGIHALCNVVDGLLATLSGLTSRSREELWAPYAAVPARMRAELLGRTVQP